jgi:hypothetical protein
VSSGVFALGVGLAREADVPPSIVVPIVEGWDKLGVDVPELCVWGVERPQGPVRGVALARAAQIASTESVRVTPTRVGSSSALEVRGSALGIFDAALLRDLAERLGTSNLAIAMPARDLLVVTGADEHDDVARLVDHAADAYECAPRATRLTSTVFIAEDGTLTGVADGIPRRRGFFSRLA